MLMNWNLEKLQKITNASKKSQIKQNLKVRGFSIDTRSIQSGELFCALKGKNYDGHDFLNQAYKKGASCFLLSNTEKFVPSIPYIKVENVLDALENIARKTRKTLNAGFIAITGSVGKTGTKEMIRFALKNVGKTYANKGNFNNHIGVPLSLSNIPDDTEYCILELGMNQKGEIKKLSSLVSPDIGIITAIENSHLKGLKTLENILEAKCELLENIKQNGCFIYNSDTNYSYKLKKKAESLNITNIISYGKNANPDIKLLEKIKVKDKNLLKVRYFDREISWMMPLLAEHWYINFLCILGIAKYYNLNLNSLLHELESFKLPSGRGNLICIEKWSKKFFIIDDSYNSSPASLKASLENFNQIDSRGNKIAIIGDMYELGEKSQKFHLSMKREIENTNLNIIFTIGKFTKKLNQELSNSIQKYHFDDISDLEKELKKIINTNDILLVKGSNAVGLNTLVSKIVGDQNDL